MAQKLSTCTLLWCWVEIEVMGAGQEVAFAKERGLAEPQGSLEPALLSRLLLCYYASLVSSMDKPLGTLSLPSSASAQALQLHTILKYVSYWSLHV